jgi:hypothetical protein
MTSAGQAAGSACNSRTYNNMKISAFFLAPVALICDSIIMKRIIETLMNRDGLTRQEAEDQVTAFNSEMWMDVGQGGSLLDWEESFSSEFGLEPDFFEDLVL